MARPEKDYFEFERIRHFDEALDALGDKFSKKQIAKALNVSPSTLTRWRKEKKMPMDKWMLIKDPDTFKLHYEIITSDDVDKPELSDLLGNIRLEELLQEIDSRGFDVSIKPKGED